MFSSFVSHVFMELSMLMQLMQLMQIIHDVYRLKMWRKLSTRFCQNAYTRQDCGFLLSEGANIVVIIVLCFSFWFYHLRQSVFHFKFR